MSSGGDSQIDESEVPNIDDESAGIMEEEESNQVNKEDNEKLIIQQSEKDLTCGTYIFSDEDHTLGNALRYMITKRTDVQLCGYSIPHPSESILNMRIQTLGKNSTFILQEGLYTLANACQTLQNSFLQALNIYEKQKSK